MSHQMSEYDDTRSYSDSQSVRTNATRTSNFKRRFATVVKALRGANWGTIKRTLLGDARVRTPKSAGSSLFSYGESAASLERVSKSRGETFAGDSKKFRHVQLQFRRIELRNHRGMLCFSLALLMLLTALLTLFDYALFEDAGGLISTDERMYVAIVRMGAIVPLAAFGIYLTSKKNYLRNPQRGQLVNVVLAHVLFVLLLIQCALDGKNVTRHSLLCILFVVMAVFSFNVALVHILVMSLEGSALCVVASLATSGNVLTNSELAILAIVMAVPNIFLALASLASLKTRIRSFARRITLNEEKTKTARLLEVVLPKPVAHASLAGCSQFAESYEDVLLFASDIVDFTRLSANVSAIELVSMLNGLISDMDDMASAHGLEKVKTIGDAYICCHGLYREPGARAVAQEAIQIAMFAFDVLDSMPRYSIKDQPLAIRIGIACGGVSAGVVGTQHRWMFDMWGEALEEATLMETTCEVNSCQVSERACALINEEKDQKPFYFMAGKGGGFLVRRSARLREALATDRAVVGSGINYVMSGTRSLLSVNNTELDGHLGSVGSMSDTHWDDNTLLDAAAATATASDNRSPARPLGGTQEQYYTANISAPGAASTGLAEVRTREVLWAQVKQCTCCLGRHTEAISRMDRESVQGRLSTMSLWGRLGVRFDTMKERQFRLDFVHRNSLFLTLFPFAMALFVWALIFVPASQGHDIAIGVALWAFAGLVAMAMSLVPRNMDLIQGLYHVVLLLLVVALVAFADTNVRGLLVLPLPLFCMLFLVPNHQLRRRMLHSVGYFLIMAVPFVWFGFARDYGGGFANAVLADTAQLDACYGLLLLTAALCLAFPVMWTEGFSARAYFVYDRQEADEANVNRTLLANVIPDQVASRIAACMDASGRVRLVDHSGVATVADKHDCVTVLFVNVLNFDKIGERLNIAQTLALLTQVFNIFEEVSNQFGVEKVKSIKSTYMCVTGLEKNVDDHCARAANFALVVRDIMGRLCLEFARSAAPSRLASAEPSPSTLRRQHPNDLAEELVGGGGLTGPDGNNLSFANIRAGPSIGNVAVNGHAGGGGSNLKLASSVADASAARPDAEAPGFVAEQPVAADSLGGLGSDAGDLRSDSGCVSGTASGQLLFESIIPAIGVGFCSGSLVAGVIGKTRFCYDVWGDTVNTSSRMLSLCKEDGDIIFPAASYELLKNEQSYKYAKFLIRQLGRADVKGKGSLDVFKLISAEADIGSMMQMIHSANRASSSTVKAASSLNASRAPRERLVSFSTKAGGDGGGSGNSSSASGRKLSNLSLSGLSNGGAAVNRKASAVNLTRGGEGKASINTVKKGSVISRTSYGTVEPAGQMLGGEDEAQGGTPRSMTLMEQMQRRQEQLASPPSTSDGVLRGGDVSESPSSSAAALDSTAAPEYDLSFGDEATPTTNAAPAAVTVTANAAPIARPTAHVSLMEQMRRRDEEYRRAKEAAAAAAPPDPPAAPAALSPGQPTRPNAEPVAPAAKPTVPTRGPSLMEQMQQRDEALRRAKEDAPATRPGAAPAHLNEEPPPPSSAAVAAPPNAVAANPFPPSAEPPQDETSQPAAKPAVLVRGPSLMEQ